MDQHMLQRVQEAYQTEYQHFQSFAAPLQTLAKSKAQYLAQIQENTDVLDELNLVDDEADGHVYKMYGPVLVKQDLDEAKNNVSKRLEFMQAQLDKIDGDMRAKQADMDKAKQKMVQIQELFNNATNELKARAAAAAQQTNA